ncbi:MAG TPA: S8 family serine peptidase, partial [Rhodanobacteraceae bacterium]|nr:S8 family serine peptidase [Rhodanobacteraceae bacterium]
MSKSLHTSALASAVAIALLGASFSVSMPAGKAAVLKEAPRTYIVRFVEPGLLHYDGGVTGLAATAPDRVGSRKLDVHTPASIAYSRYLDGKRAEHIAAIQQLVGGSLAISHSYAILMNGVAVELTAADAARVAGLPGIKSVEPEKYQHLTTYRGPTFIGADKIWDGTATPSGVGTRGEGIIVGDLDTGANSTHPSFANDPACGFSAGNPKLIAVDCSSSAGGLCNGPDPEAAQGNGHGVHTASTAAGNTIDNTAVPPPSLPDGITMSGVAPCASLRSYKVCQTNQCGSADIAAGIENAITDQVDVLNFSISGGTSPWNDNDRDFLDAVNADVFVAAAAGNLQAGETDPTGLVNHKGPWLLSVAASTQDEIIGPSLSLTGPGTPPPEGVGVPLNPGSTTQASATPTLNDFPIRTDPDNAAGCTDGGGIPAGLFTDSIAVLRRGASEEGGTACSFTEKITNAFNAGAVLVVIGNNVAGSVNMDTTGAPAVPAYSVSMVAGNALIDFATTNPSNATADVAPIAVANVQGDVLADFSYRGPTPAPLADLTKPDISAPGVNIYAALTTAEGSYGFLSGTSMATPHITGSGALVRAVHPDWTVEEVKSALQTTATNTNGVEEDGVTPWTIDDVGSGRVDLTTAALAGLTLDESYANFLAANPSGGTINVRDLNIPSLRNVDCQGGCTWTRTVTNKLATQGSWNTSFVPISGGITASVTPASFTIAPGATQVLTITAQPPAGGTAEISFGNVVFTEANGQSPDQHFTVAINAPLIDPIFQDGFDGVPPPPSGVCEGGVCTLQVDGLPDSGGNFNSLGGGDSPFTFLWLNQFTPDASEYPITLNTVDTIFSDTGTTIGDTFDVYVYQDDDNDPSNGATLVDSVLGETVTVQNSIQSITIPGGTVLDGPGEVLIALVNRTVNAYPASADDGVDFAGFSWVGGLGSVGSPPDLA